MSDDYSETIAAAMAGRTVRLSWLIEADFLSGRAQYWLGFGDLAAGGKTWKGLGDVVAVSEVVQPVNGDAEQVQITLSGVNRNFVQGAVTSEAEYKGRWIWFYLQFFDENSQPLDQPSAEHAGTMEDLTFAASGPTTRTVTVAVENLFGDRGSPPWGLYTDRDQQQRFPGDLGLVRVPLMVNKTVKWPAF